MTVLPALGNGICKTPSQRRLNCTALPPYCALDSNIHPLLLLRWLWWPSVPNMEWKWWHSLPTIRLAVYRPPFHRGRKCLPLPLMLYGNIFTSVNGQWWQNRHLHRDGILAELQTGRNVIDPLTHDIFITGITKVNKTWIFLHDWCQIIKCSTLLFWTKTPRIISGRLWWKYGPQIALQSTMFRVGAIV